MKAIANMFLSIITFFLIFGFLVSQVAGSTFVLLNPLVLGIVSLSMIATAVAGNTPLVRGASMALTISAITGAFIIDFLTLGVSVELAGLILVPIVLGLLFVFIEASRGS